MSKRKQIAVIHRPREAIDADRMALLHNLGVKVWQRQIVEAEIGRLMLEIENINQEAARLPPKAGA